MTLDHDAWQLLNLKPNSHLNREVVIAQTAQEFKKLLREAARLLLAFSGAINVPNGLVPTPRPKPMIGQSPSLAREHANTATQRLTSSQKRTLLLNAHKIRWMESVG